MENYPIELQHEEPIVKAVETPPPRPLSPKSPKEEILETGEKADSRELNGGMNKTVFINIVDDGSGIFKPAMGEVAIFTGIPKGTYHKRERAAYLVSQMLGFNFVPPTVIREIDGEVGSVQQFIPDAKSLHQASDHEFGPEDLRKLWIFDLLIYNADRRGPNCLVKDGHLIPIDHGCCFGPAFLRTYQGFMDQPIPADLIENLKQFAAWENNKSALRQLLLELLVEPEVDAFFARLERVTKDLVAQGHLTYSAINYD